MKSVEKKRSDVTFDYGVIDKIRTSFKPEEVKDFLAKVSAARAYHKAIKNINESRIVLLEIEIECIIRLHLLDEKIQGYPKSISLFFYENGNDVSYYLDKYPDCLTAKSIYRCFVNEKEMAEAKEKAWNSASGYKESTRDYTSNDLIVAANYERMNLSGAIKVIINHLADSEEEFSVSDVVSKLDVPDAYRSGVSEICRKAITRERIETVNGFIAPKFVTYCDENEEDMWMRIPFSNSTTKQLYQMIELREQQLKEDTAALNNLKKIYEYLVKNSEDGICKVSEIVSKTGKDCLV